MNNAQLPKSATQQAMPNDILPGTKKNSLRVLRVITSMNPHTGGPCQGIRNSIPAMNALGVVSEVVCLDDADAGFLKSKQDPFVIHALGHVNNPWHYSKKLMRWLLQNLQRFDVVIVHGLWLYSSYAVYKAMRQLKYSNTKLPAWFVMPHGMLDPYFQKAEGRKLKAIRNNIYWKLIESKVIKNASAVLFTCDEEMRLAATTFKDYQPKQVFNVGYGIAAPPLYTTQMQEAFLEKCAIVREKKYLLFLSRIHEKKGVDLLVKAYEILLKDGSCNDVPHLVIAGPGLEDTYGNALAKYVDASELLRNKIFFTGMLTGDAKWGAFYGCDAFVLPSHQENFGIAVVEALACGKPVLITDKVNIWREVEIKQSGLISSDNESEIYNLLMKWMSLTDGAKVSMQSNASDVFKNHFSSEQAAHKLLETISISN